MAHHQPLMHTGVPICRSRPSDTALSSFCRLTYSSTGPCSSLSPQKSSCLGKYPSYPPRASSSTVSTENPSDLVQTTPISSHNVHQTFIVCSKCNSIIPYIRNARTGAGEIAQLFKALAVLSKTWVWFLAPSSSPLTPVLEDMTPSSLLL